MTQCGSSEENYEQVAKPGTAEAHLVHNHKSYSVDMWKVRQHMFEAPEFKRSNTGLLRYLFFLAVLFNYIDSLPWRSTALKHKVGLEDLLLDEEFSDVHNHKKTFHDVATVEELWQWARGPLGAALLADDSNPGSLAAILGSNAVIGPVRLRQARVTELQERVAHSLRNGGADGVACGAAYGAGGCCERRNSSQCRFDFGNEVWENPTTTGWTERLDDDYYNDRARYCVTYPRDMKCSSCDDPMHRKLANGAFSKDCTTDSPVHEPWEAYGSVGPSARAPLKGSRSFVDEHWGIEVESFDHSTIDEARELDQFKLDIDLTEVVTNATGCLQVLGSPGSCRRRADNSIVPLTGVEYLAEILTSIEEGKHPFKVDIHTRAVSFQFVLYCGHHSTAGGTIDLANILTWVEIMFYLEPSGHVGHHARITPVPVPNSCFLDKGTRLQFAMHSIPGAMAHCIPDTVVRMSLAPVYSWDFFFCITTVLSLVWLLYEEIEEIVRNDFKIVAHFSSGWNFVELLFFMFLAAYVSSTFTFSSALSDAIEKLLERPNDFTDLSGVRSALRTRRWCFGVFLFIVVIKLAKFVRVAGSLRILWRTLEYAAVDLCFFGLNLVLLLFAFGLCGIFTYGTSVPGFHNVLASVTSWARISIGEGEYDYKRMSSAWSLTSLFIVLFMIIVVIIAMNTFVAILSTSYDSAKSESKEWYESRRKLRDHYVNDERGLYNEPQDIVDLYDAATVALQRFQHGMKTILYRGYSVARHSEEETVHYLKTGHEVWIKMDSRTVPHDAPMVSRVCSRRLSSAGTSESSSTECVGQAGEDVSFEVDASWKLRTSDGEAEDAEIWSEQELFGAIAQTDVAKRERLFIRNKFDSLNFLQQIEALRRDLAILLRKKLQLRSHGVGGGPQAGYRAPGHPTAQTTRRLCSRCRFKAMDPAAHAPLSFELRLNGEEHTAASVKLKDMVSTIDDLDGDVATGVLPGFVQVNSWAVLEVTRIRSWHDYSRPQSSNRNLSDAIRVRACDKMYWIITSTTYMQLIQLRFSKLIWRVPLHLLGMTLHIFTCGTSWFIERWCSRWSKAQSTDKATKRMKKLRKAAVRFLQLRVKKLGDRNQEPGNVLKSMKFYSDFNMPLAEMVTMMEYDIFHSNSAWRPDLWLYRRLRPTLGFANAYFDQTDREMLYACFNDPELLSMNLLEYTATDDHQVGAACGTRTEWIDQQEQDGDNTVALQQLIEQLRRVAGEVQRVSSRLGLPQDVVQRELVQTAVGGYSGGATLHLRFLCPACNCRCRLMLCIEVRPGQWHAASHRISTTQNRVSCLNDLFVVCDVVGVAMCHDCVRVPRRAVARATD